MLTYPIQCCQTFLKLRNHRNQFIIIQQPMEQESSDCNNIEIEGQPTTQMEYPQQKNMPKEHNAQKMFIQTIEVFMDIVRNHLKDSDENYFQLKEPSLAVIQKIIQQWKLRGIKNNRCILKLSIQSTSLELGIIIAHFQQVPSIIVTFNGIKIQNSQILQIVDDIFYEGTSQSLYYHDFKGKIEYYGDVENRVPNGKGYMQCTQQNDHFSYVGQFKNGQFHGFGELHDKKNMVSYFGQFENDCKHGEGHEIIIQKNSKGKIRKWHYHGRFVNGRREGQGTQKSHYGTYQGSWKEGEKCGKGSFKFKNGNQYEGNWESNQFHGNGTLIEKGKGTYKGSFAKGLFQGKGIYSYDNGDKYDGDFSKNLRDGEGIYTWRDGDYYEGEWKKDKAHGKGQILNGLSFYDGQFKQGYKNGKGQLTKQDGTIVNGKWQNNELVEGISN